MFEPTSVGGPSGLADLPRPFVFRAGKVAGKAFARGELFEIDIHVFDIKNPAFVIFATTMVQLEQYGLGPYRSRVRLECVSSIEPSGAEGATVFANGRIVAKHLPPLELSLDDQTDCHLLEVRFLTPTEIKEPEGDGVPSFHGLAGRIRDRIANLRAAYGDGPIDLDFRKFSERARLIRVVSHDLQSMNAARRSSRSGQRHSLGGFVGTVQYEGELGTLIPWLQAAYWTGVGRQTVWGKGVVEIIPSS